MKNLAHGASVISGGESSKILKGTGMKNVGLRGVTHRKLIGFCPFTYYIMENFATFLDFSFLFFIFLSNCSFSLEF